MRAWRKRDTKKNGGAGAACAHLRGLLHALGVPLGASWGPLGASCMPLGVPLRGLLVSPWGLLHALGGLLHPLGGLLSASCIPFKRLFVARCVSIFDIIGFV